MKDHTLQTFLKTAQYIARITTSQDLYDEIARLMVAAYDALWVIFARKDPSDSIIIHASNHDDKQAQDLLIQHSIHNKILQVIESGFLDFERLPDKTLLFLPLHGSQMIREVMIIGYPSEQELSKETMNLMLGISGLVEVAIEKRQAEKELIDHRDRLNLLVDERTKELEEANQLLRERERFLNNSIEAIGHPFAVIDADSLEIELANQAYGGPSVLGEKCFSVSLSASLHCYQSTGDCPIPKIKETGKPLMIERVIESTKTIYEATFHPMLDHTGKVVKVIQQVRDITERKHMEEDLRVAKERAELASKAKSQFVSNMSHEIRTPLNSVIGFSNILKKTAVNPEQKEYLGYIASSAQNLLALVNDILDFSKIEAGKMEIYLETASLETICERSIDSVRFEAHEKGLDLKMEIHPYLKDKHIKTDPDRLRQVLLNLLSNAVKFTQAGSVSFSVSYETDTLTDDHATLVFSVKDTGPGISQEDQNRLFEEFYRIDNSISRKTRGTGLGLPISQQILKLMGSKLEINSQPGSGSVFSFRLRAVLMDESTARSQILSGQSTPEQNDSVTDWQEGAYKILVAEDNLLNQKLIRTLLSNQFPNAALFLAETGLEAVEHICSHPLDLILMDLLMPEMGGVEATQNIRKLECGRDIPIIALTANVESSEISRCFEVGMNGYLTKPIVLDELLAELKRWLRPLGDGVK